MIVLEYNTEGLIKYAEFISLGSKKYSCSNWYINLYERLQKTFHIDFCTNYFLFNRKVDREPSPVFPLFACSFFNYLPLLITLLWEIYCENCKHVNSCCLYELITIPSKFTVFDECKYCLNIGKLLEMEKLWPMFVDNDHSYFSNILSENTKSSNYQNK